MRTSIGASFCLSSTVCTTRAPCAHFPQVGDRMAISRARSLLARKSRRNGWCSESSLSTWAAAEPQERTAARTRIPLMFLSYTIPTEHGKCKKGEVAIGGDGEINQDPFRSLSPYPLLSPLSPFSYTGVSRGSSWFKAASSMKRLSMDSGRSSLFFASIRSTRSSIAGETRMRGFVSDRGFGASVRCFTR